MAPIPALRDGSPPPRESVMPAGEEDRSQSLWTLVFRDRALEDAWWRHYGAPRVRMMRIALVLLVVGIPLFGLADLATFPTAHADMMRVRWVITAALAAAIPWVFGRGSTAGLARGGQGVMLYVSAVTEAGLIALWWVAAPTANGDSLMVTAVSVLFAMNCQYCVSGLRFGAAVGIAAVMTPAYFVVTAVRTNASLAGAAGGMVPFILVAAVSTLAANWSLEYYGRRGFLRKRDIDAERRRSDRLVRNIMPAALADRLAVTPGAVLDRLPSATVLFATVVGFDAATRALGPLDVVQKLDQVVAAFDRLAWQHGVERIKTIGATYMAAAGLPLPANDHARRAARMAIAMREALGSLPATRGLDVSLRVGLCSGAVMAGVIGRTRFAFDCWGDTTNTAARLDTSGEPGRIQVAAATAALLPSDEFRVEPRGRVEVKGKGALETFWLVGAATGA